MQNAGGTPLLSKFGNLLMREILVVTSASARLPARTDSGGRGGESQDNQTGGGECHLFLSENCAILLGSQRFSWREMACPPSLLKKGIFKSLAEA